MTREDETIEEAPPARDEPEGDGEHLQPHELGAFLDGALRGAERSRVEAHLVECARCREEAIHVGRLTGTGNGNGKQRKRLVYWVAPAAAAAVVAALLLLGPGAEEVARPEAPILRADDPGVTAIAVVSPRAGASLSSDSVVFVWREVESGVVYRLTLMDQEGVVLWKETVEDTTVALSADVELRPGARYYWYVDALLELARTATSGVQEFTISP